MRNYELTCQTSFPSPVNIINSKYLNGWDFILLNACKYGPSYDHKLPLSRLTFSNNSEIVIWHEIPPSIRIWETSKRLILAIIIKEMISLRVPQIFSKSHNPIIGRSGFFVDLPLSFLWMVSISLIFLFLVPLEMMFSQGSLPEISVIYWCFPMLAFLSSLLV